VAATALAQSPFDGTWRPDPQKPPASQPPDVVQITPDLYKCVSCEPPYAVKPDGLDHPIAGNSRYDTLSITIVDARTVKKVAKKSGQPAIESTMTVSADGRALTEAQVLYIGPRKFAMTRKSVRAAPASAGANLVSGSWRLLEADLTNHDEDTTFKVSGGTLTMADHMGRSFHAKLDGTDAPYEGDADFTSVSLKVIDPRTIEEYDKKDGKVVKISRWTIDPDGRTIHARFDDTHGKVQTQTGHKIESSG
jgi:hypothetical protein